MKFILFRHGNSLANQEFRIVSSMENGTATTGGPQGTGFGLSSQGVAEVTASLETSFDIPVALPEETLDLRERFFGEFEMRTPSDDLYQLVWNEDAIDPFHEKYGVESVAMVTKRTTSVIRKMELEEQERGDKENVSEEEEKEEVDEEAVVILVSHGDALQILQTAMRGWSGDRHRQLEHLDTANWREVAWSPEQAEARRHPAAAATPTTKSVRPPHLILRSMTKEDEPEVAKLFASTFKREPLGAYCGVTIEEGLQVARSSLKEISFVVEDPTLPKDHQLVAFRTSCLLTKSKVEADKQKREQQQQRQQQQQEKKKKNGSDKDGDDDDDGDAVQQVLGHMMDLWSHNTTAFDNDSKDEEEVKVMKFIALGVDDRYEGMGLAKELLNKAMEKAKETKVAAVVVIASAFATQHLFSKRLGFELMGRVRYADFEISEEGGGGGIRRPFANLHEPEFLEVYEKKLE
ncbi:hypothetical protein BG004_000675 [Podila humilis]|nr:hypothetical protein BG004_000675 [Podila humilis]